MGSRPVNPEIDALLDVARLRALARHLVADPLAAEDLVQDAWAAALARPAPPRDLGAWLAGAVRHLARRARRGLERRAQREAASARAEAGPSTLSLTERSEVLERLLAAVRGLDEPYRRTVLLHFFEGWTLERIARDEGAPASTVRNRLSRALGELRERLDREARGDRSVWLSALAPFARAELAGSDTILTTLAMGTTTKLVLASAAAGGVLLALLVPAPAGAEILDATTEAAREEAAPAGATETTAAPLANADTGSARTPASIPSAGTEQLVYGAVEGPGGEPVQEGGVSFTDVLGESRSATLGSGAYSIVGLAPGSWDVRADCQGFLPRSESLVLEPGRASTRLDLVLARSRTLRVKFVDPGGKPILDATSERFRSPLLAAIATRERPAERIAGVRGRMPGYYAAGVYRSPVTFGDVPGLPPDCAGLLELREPPPLWVSAVLGDVVLQSRLVGGGEEEVVFELGQEELRRPRGGLRVRVVDAESGAPLAGNAALAFTDTSGGGMPFQPDGTIEFLDETAGRRELELHSPGHASVKRAVRLRAGEVVDLGTIALEPERTIRGRLSDEEGRPLATRLTWVAAAHVASLLDLDQRVGAQSGPDGSFELFWTGTGEVLLFADRKEFAANPIRIAPGGDAEVEAVAPRGTLVVIRPLAHGGPGALFAFADERGPFWSDGVWERRPLRVRLVPGTYQLWTCRDEVVERVETIIVGAETLVLER